MSNREICLVLVRNTELLSVRRIDHLANRALRVSKILLTTFGIGWVEEEGIQGKYGQRKTP